MDGTVHYIVKDHSEKCTCYSIGSPILYVVQFVNRAKMHPLLFSLTLSHSVKRQIEKRKKFNAMETNYTQYYLHNSERLLSTILKI